MSQSPQPKRSVPLAALSLIIGVAALVAFVLLNRMMAPPFPRFSVSPTAGLAFTNSAASQPTNSAPPTNK
jgi:hypothetical protein